MKRQFTSVFWNGEDPARLKITITIESDFKKAVSKSDWDYLEGQLKEYTRIAVRSGFYLMPMEGEK